MIDDITSGRWPLGSQLPSERVLCETHQVSRTVLREALAALQLAGYIETRMGDGSYVALSRPTSSLPGSHQAVDAAVDVAELIEAREAIDIAAIHLAIRNASTHQLDALDDIRPAMSAAVAKASYKEYIELTLQLHRAIGEATQSAIIQDVVAQLISAIEHSLWVIEERYTQPIAEHSLRIHLELIRALQARDFETALAAMRAHYQEYPALLHKKDAGSA